MLVNDKELTPEDVVQILMLKAVGDDTDERRTYCKMAKYLQPYEEHLLWTAGVNSATELPYVYVDGSKKQVSTSRVLMRALLDEPLADFLKIIVLCEFRNCLAPMHLDVMTHGTHIRAATEAYRTARRINMGLA